jgi:hypothetical protein
MRSSRRSDLCFAPPSTRLSLVVPEARFGRILPKHRRASLRASVSRTEARNAAVGSHPAGEPNLKGTLARLWGSRELVVQPPAVGEPGMSNDHSGGQHGSRRAERRATYTVRLQTPSL